MANQLNYICILLAINSCAASVPSEGVDPDIWYGVEFQTIGDQNITGVSAYDGAKFYAGAGYLSPDNSATEFPLVPPVPDSVTVKWCNEQGEVLARLVELKGKIPLNFTDYIVFTINSKSNAVDVTVRDRVEKRR